jgi:hypothetical protein
MWLLTSFLWFVQLFCDLCCIFLKAQITLNAKCVLSALASFQFIPLKVQIGPTCQNDIFGLHVPVLDVQTFPEAQTAVEFWTEMSFEVSENLLQAAFWVWTSYTTALHSSTITATALSECVAKTLWCKTGSSLDNPHGGWLRNVWLVSGEVQSLLRFTLAFCGLQVWSDCSDGKA